MRYGLLPLSKDDRDLKLGAIFTYPKLSDIPDSFSLDVLGIKDQKDTDFCTAFASCLVSELQEGVKLEPSYSFAVSKELSGGLHEWGQDIRYAMKSHAKVGAIESKVSPFSLDTEDEDMLRDITNWPPSLKLDALRHKKKSYLEVTGPYTPFDDIRAAIWKFRKEKRGVVSGVKWSWPSSQVTLDTEINDGGGHCIAYVGWKGDYLKLVNSYGRDAGDNGVHWIHKDIVNKYAGLYGAFMFVDISPEEARFYQQNGSKVDVNWLRQLLATFISIFKRL